MTKDEALRMALEALDSLLSQYYADTTTRDDLEKAEAAITAIREALADSALDRMAENARELGLDYEPPCKTGSQCASKCQQCEQSAQQEPSTLFESFQEFGEGWERLAWELCADENGEEACSELIWEGGPIPEPWGDRWLKYEDEAKRLIALVQKHTSPQPAQQQEPNKDGSPCPEFWEWLPKTYNFEGDGNFTKYNMEVAFLAGKQSVTQQQEPTVEDNSQNWRGMDGTTAYWLIQRHADGWSDIGKMMGEWLEANQAQPAQQHGCSRSHPHENMDAMCELRTEIARLTNENARLKLQRGVS